MKWKNTNQDTFYFNNQYINKFNKTVSKIDLKFLYKEVLKSKNNKSRLCLHKSPNSVLQQMIIFHKKNHKVKIHKHLLTEESYFLIKGRMSVNFYNSKGVIIKNINLSANSNTLPFFISVPKNTFHNQIFYQDTIFLELKNGPFKKKNDIFL